MQIRNVTRLQTSTSKYFNLNLVLKCPSQYFPCWNDFGQLGKCLKVVNEINESRLKMCVAVLAVEECFDFDVSDTKRVS